jgi:DNA-binding transcriptional LysR family regulator
MDLGNVDFNLLKVLDALISERNVTRAGVRLGRSQPAVSNALGKLRKILGDDLLVRGPNGFILTPRAEAIRTPLREAIGLAESCLAGEAQFNPATATGVFRLSTPDRLSIAVVPPQFDRLRKLTPNMSLQVLTADRKQALDLLDQDRTDIALGWLDEKPGPSECRIHARGKTVLRLSAGSPDFEAWGQIRHCSGAVLSACHRQRHRKPRGDFRRFAVAPPPAA